MSTAPPVAPPVPRARPRPQRRFAATLWHQLLIRPDRIAGPAFAIAGIVVHLARISSAPDTVFDETAYTRAAFSVEQSGALSWGEGPVFIHPPLFFLLQALWLRLAEAVGLLRDPGMTGQALFRAIYAARLLDGVLAGCCVGLVYLVTWRLAGVSGRRRGWVAALAATLTLLDPVMIHYGRMVLIEPLALLLIMLTLLAGWRWREQPTRDWALRIGLLTGVCLLTKELLVFWLLAPLVAAVLGRDREGLRRAVGALGIGIAFWFVTFLGWSIWLGRLGSFGEAKLFTLKRLVGLVQSTGLNRSDADPVHALLLKAPIYGASYALVIVGGLASLALFTRRTSEARQLLFGILFSTYAFAGYTVAFGQFNEQFFVYVMPFAAIATAIVAGHLLGDGGWPVRLVALVVVAAILLAAGGSYLRVDLRESSRGFQQLALAVQRDVPQCALVNTSGEIQAWQYAVPDHVFVDDADGEQGVRDGVRYFLLSPEAARNHYPNMSPQLASFILRNGTLVAEFPSREYDTYRLYRVTPTAFEQQATTESSARRGGRTVFVATQGNYCGGYPVTDSAGGRMLTGWQNLGGLRTVGPPASRAWDVGATGHGAARAHREQLFATALLTTSSGSTVAGAAPVIARLAAGHPEALAALPVTIRTARPGSGPLALLTDAGIATTYLGRPARQAGNAQLAAARRRWGAPLGPPRKGPDGIVRQAFSSVVLERRPGQTQAQPAVIAPLLAAAGLVPAKALRVQPQQRGHLDVADFERSQVSPFLWLLAASLGVWGLFLLRGRRRRGGLM